MTIKEFIEKLDAESNKGVIERCDFYGCYAIIKNWYEHLQTCKYRVEFDHCYHSLIETIYG